MLTSEAQVKMWPFTAALAWMDCCKKLNGCELGKGLWIGQYSADDASLTQVGRDSN